MKINSLQTNNFNQLNSRRFEQSSNNVSFKGGLPSRAYERATDGLAVLLGKFASTKFAKNVVDFFKGESKSKILRGIGQVLDIKHKWLQHAIAAESIYLTGFYMYNTKKAKHIPEDQKRPMMVNQALVTTLCTSIGYIVDGKMSKLFKSLQNFYLTANAIPFAEKTNGQITQALKAAGNNQESIKAITSLPMKRVNAIFNGISKLKSVLVFGFIYRYFSPVFITPIANRVSEYLDKKSAKNNKAA